MKRFLSAALILVLTIALTACAGNTKGNWGGLNVTLADQKNTGTQWQAKLVVANKSSKMLPFQYIDKNQYTLRITQNGKEIYTQVFNPVQPPSVRNLAPNTTAEHLVIWRFEDQSGKKVPPGTYEAKVDLHAVTSGVKGPPAVSAVKVDVK